MKYASVIVNISHENLDKVYEYGIPKEWETYAVVGAQVLIPFGKGNKERKGFILQIADTSEFDPNRIKNINSVITEGQVLESHFIQLAAWIRQQYGSTMNDALRAVLPVKKKIKEQETKYLYRNVETDRLSVYLEECERKHYKARERLCQALMEQEVLPQSVATKEYQVSLDAIRKLEELGILRIETKRTYRNPISSTLQVKEKVELTDTQKYVVQSVWEEMEEGNQTPVLIHGVTGSGKTEVYMELIERVQRMGKQAIFLLPEIALTVAMVERFHNRFGQSVSVLHSRLSEGERSDQYERAKKGEISVMIGPRSALFTPFSNLGLIILDEEHEPSFQNENQPKYHTREVAIQRAGMYGAKVVMGSATPSVDSFYKAKKGIYQLYTMKERVGDSVLPKVTVVDMRRELKARNRSIFSRELACAIREALARKKQTLLFLNRRGYAGFVSCRSCGEVLKCPHCDVSLTEHTTGKLVCHYCGYEQWKNKKCPSCGSPYIAAFGIGTQKVEEYAKREFPNARILRMDGDTTSRKGDYERILATFASGGADILIGTQMAAKGHDFANVAVVGAVAADLTMFVNDYRSSERTYQLLSQAGGRAGRRQEKGRVFIQTYQPEHYCIEAAKKQDYEAFYENEISYRQLLNYPPMGQMMAILVLSKKEEQVELATKLLGGAIQEQIGSLVMIGPAKATVYKIQDQYRKVIYLKGKEKETLIQMKDYLEGFAKVSKVLQNVNIYYDFNPMNGY